MDHNPRQSRRKARTPRPLDSIGLRDLAMRYVARYATTSGKLRRYLARKLREREWVGENVPDIDGLVASFEERGFVDDAGWAEARASALTARGYGTRRIGEDLRAAGIDADIREDNVPGEREVREAAVRLAKRRRFGPFGQALTGEEGQRRRDRQLAAMARAGHDFASARRVIEAASEVDLAIWVDEAEDQDEGDYAR